MAWSCSLAWVNAWLSEPLTVADCERLLPAIGFELDAANPIPALPEGVLVGRIERLEPHPNADRLSVCTLDIGQHSPLNVVCGCPSVQEGMMVPVATVGTVLPSGMTLRPTTLRGVRSEGMCCSAEELGWQHAKDGVLALPGCLEPGTPMASYCPANDTILTIDVTPNRGDCLSVAGLSRALAMGSQGRTRWLGWSQPSFETAELPDALQDGALLRPSDASVVQQCWMAHLSLEVTDRVTPPWMLAQLLSCGMLPRGDLLIDVTQYVMCEIGQPMHAYDASAVTGGLSVQRLGTAHADWSTLLGTSLNLAADDVVVVDQQAKVCSLAGVLGGEATAVRPTSSTILLEAAAFAPSPIAETLRRTSLFTDASFRFERGVDPALAPRALARALHLLVSSGAELMSWAGQGQAPQPVTVAFQPSSVRRRLGVKWSDEKILDGLKMLDFMVETSNPWVVSVPSYRGDVRLPADLSEELLNLHGYDALLGNARDLKSPSVTPPETTVRFDEDAWLDACVAQGFTQTIQFAFLDPASQAACCKAEDVTPLRLRNPLSQQLSELRVSLLPGLLDRAVYHARRQQPNVKLSEAGRVFAKNPQGEGHEGRRLAGVWTGSATPEQWDEQPRPVDFYDMKGAVEALLARCLPHVSCDFVPECTHPLAHPGQSANLMAQGTLLGRVAMLHPSSAASFKLSKSTAWFEFFLDHQFIEDVPLVQEPSAFPSIRRDVSLLVPEGVNFQEVRDCILENAGDALEDVLIFDQYVPSNGQDLRRLALGLLFQHQDRSLVDDEVSAHVAGTLEVLEARLNVTMRQQ